MSSETLRPVIISDSRPLYLPASKLEEMARVFESESSTDASSPQNAAKVKDVTEKISESNDINSIASDGLGSRKRFFGFFWKCCGVMGLRQVEQGFCVHFLP